MWNSYSLPIFQQQKLYHETYIIKRISPELWQRHFATKLTDRIHNSSRTDIPPDGPVTISQCASYGKFHIRLRTFLHSVHNLFTHLSPIYHHTLPYILLQQLLNISHQSLFYKLATLILYITDIVHVRSDDMSWFDGLTVFLCLWTVFREVRDVRVTYSRPYRHCCVACFGVVANQLVYPRCCAISV